MQRSEKDAAGLHTRVTGQGCPTAGGTPACKFPSVASPLPPCPPPPPALHVLSSLPEFSFLFKSKAKKDILKDWVLNPFYSALCTDGSDVCVVFK